ncbi:MAG: hypothetical protein IJC88_00640, partial [Oscillospiraceae bacterium]|nr:hypothetical protein [Oscillospiraceae bacterium]
RCFSSLSLQKSSASKLQSIEKREFRDGERVKNVTESWRIQNIFCDAIRTKFRFSTNDPYMKPPKRMVFCFTKK